MWCGTSGRVMADHLVDNLAEDSTDAQKLADELIQNVGRLRGTIEVTHMRMSLQAAFSTPLPRARRDQAPSLVSESEVRP